MCLLEDKFFQVTSLASNLCQAAKILTEKIAGELASYTAYEIKLYQAIIQLAEQMHDHGEHLAKQNNEPDYHNRQHALEVLSALYLLLEQHPQDCYAINEPDWPDFSKEEKLLLIIAALGHDFHHPGGVNQVAAEFEKISAAKVAEIMELNHIHKQHIHLVSNLILATEFSEVSALHQSIANNLTLPLSFQLRASIVLTEADIFPSILPHHGKFLADKLSREWKKAGVKNRPDPCIEQNHQRFLKLVRFSSPFSQKLQISELINAQLIM